MDVIVSKFGGSSLANSCQFKKVKEIILNNPNRRYIIPSAPGREHKDDQKVTDLLYLLYNLASHQISYMEVFNMIKKRYNDIISELKIDIDLSENFDFILEQLQNGATKEYISSRGEYLNGKVLAKYLDYDFVDASNVIFFTEEGLLDEVKTYEALDKMQKSHEKAVIPGFYGAMPDGSINTFSRGGSDLSGSIVARGVNAKIYENWTDVSGFLAADPKIVENPRKIKYITYQELRELAYSGASILHDEAIFPVISKGIPIEIRNTNKPEEEGTFIVEKIPETPRGHRITGVTGRKNFSVINIEKVQMKNDRSFHRKVMSVLEANDIYLEHMPSSIDSLSLIVSDKELQGKTDAVINEIKTLCNPDDINIVNNISLVAVVGRNMIKHIGASSKVFSSLAKEGINIEMIIQGSSEINIIIGVKTECFEKAIKAIYTAFEDDVINL